MLEVYRATRPFPPDERFALTSQVRRAVLSVPTNIAEGSKRKTNQEYCRFLNIAEDSLAETEYLLMVSRDLGYIQPDKSEALLTEVTEVARMLNSLRSKVEKTN